MSDSFLSRWSRRKQQARRTERAPEPVEDRARAAPEGNEETTARAPVAVEEEAALTPEEIAALPNVEEFTLETDISAFLRKGVPESLRNAALRRMWLLDPAIRDFVGEARDYSYDWNTPGGVPGSGELLPGEDVETMVRRVFGESAPEPLEPDQSGVEASRVRDRQELSAGPLENAAASQQSRTDEGSARLSSDQAGTEKGTDAKGLEKGGGEGDPAATQHGAALAAADAVASRRHGGAKPV